MTTTATKDVPHSIEAEEGFLGSCLIDPIAIRLTPISTEDFYLQKHRWIYEAMAAVDAQQLAGSVSANGLDFITLTSELEKRDQLEAIGGAAYLTGLIQAVPSAMNARHYARIIQETARQRRLIDVAAEIAVRAYKRDKPDDIILYADKAMEDESMGSDNVKGVEDGVSSVVAKAHYYAEHPLKPGEVRGIDTGWPDVNYALGGWQRAAVHYFIAVRHFGKTWVCLNAAVNAARKGAHVGIFSLEMSASTNAEQHDKSTLWERVVLSQAQITMKQYRAGTLTPEQRARIDNEAQTLSTLDLWIDDEARDFSQIRATAFRQARKRPLDLVFIDYLGLIKLPMSRATTNKNQHIGDVCLALRDFSRDLDAALFVPHQISGKEIDRRPYENGGKRPRLDDGYESGYLSQHGDIVLGGYRDELYNQATEQPHIMDVTVLKNRMANGTGSYWNWHFAPYGALDSVYYSTNKAP